MKGATGKRVWYVTLLILFIFTLISFGTVLILGGPHWPVRKYQAANGPKAIIISLDGFRPDWLSWERTPRLAQLADDGVMTPMQPAYPTLTFPNHYTMICGLLPERHGIIGNTFYDPVKNRIFVSKDLSNSNDGSWLMAGEPFWNTLERDGGRSAVVHWAGSGATFWGRRPSFSVPFERHSRPGKVTDYILEYVRMPEKHRPNFIAAYYSAVDSASHRHGLDSREVDEAIRAVDGEIGRIVDELRNYSETNLIIVSDHGAAAVPANQRIKLSELLSDYKENLSLAVCGPTTFIYPKPEGSLKIFSKLQSSVSSYPSLRIYKKEDIPEKWKYKDNPRIPSILIQANPGWTIECDMNTSEQGKLPDRDVGDHGFPPEAPEMRALFIGRGPLFKAGTMSLSKPINQERIPRNVDVFRVLSEVFEIPCRRDIDAGPELSKRVIKNTM